MNAAPLITSGTGQFKAVCHKCQYVGFEPNCTKCPECGFPMLLEPYQSARLTLRDIFDRSTIELKGQRAPTALPGVNRTERQRKDMLARAQRRLSSVHESQTQAPQLIDRTRPSQAGPYPSSAVSQRAARVVSTPSPGLVSSLALAASTVAVGPMHAERPAPPAPARETALDRRRSLMPIGLAFMAAFAAALAMVAASGGL